MLEIYNTYTKTETKLVIAIDGEIDRRRMITNRLKHVACGVLIAWDNWAEAKHLNHV